MKYDAQGLAPARKKIIDPSTGSIFFLAGASPCASSKDCFPEFF